MAELTIREAAQRLGVTEVTIRRRIRNGDINAHQLTRPQGFIWIVELPDEDRPFEPPGHDGNDRTSEIEGVLQDMLRRQDETIGDLRRQLESREREVQELHVLVQQAQAALPAVRMGHPWWRFWQR